MKKPYQIEIYGENYDNQKTAFEHVLYMGTVGVKDDWLTWCKKNTMGQWNYHFNSKEGEGYWLEMRFEKEEDALLFKLTFC